MNIHLPSNVEVTFLCLHTREIHAHMFKIAAPVRSVSLLQSRNHPGDWISKLWYIYTVEYYTAMKINGRYSNRGGVKKKVRQKNTYNIIL